MGNLPLGWNLSAFGARLYVMVGVRWQRQGFCVICKFKSVSPVTMPEALDTKAFPVTDTNHALNAWLILRSLTWITTIIIYYSILQLTSFTVALYRLCPSNPQFSLGASRISTSVYSLFNGKSDGTLSLLVKFTEKIHVYTSLH